MDDELKSCGMRSFGSEESYETEVIRFYFVSPINLCVTAALVLAQYTLFICHDAVYLINRRPNFDLLTAPFVVKLLKYDMKFIKASLAQLTLI